VDDAIAVDAKGTLYVTNPPFNTVVEYKAGQSSPFQTITAGLDYPVALTLNETGKLFVSNLRSNNVIEYAPGSTTPLQKSISKSSAQPEGLAFSPPVLP
jgi:DNA-binding beta-propeller fold protein YncE